MAVGKQVFPAAALYSVGSVALDDSRTVLLPPENHSLCEKPACRAGFARRDVSAITAGGGPGGSHSGGAVSAGCRQGVGDDRRCSKSSSYRFFWPFC